MLSLTNINKVVFFFLYRPRDTPHHTSHETFEIPCCCCLLNPSFSHSLSLSLFFTHTHTFIHITPLYSSPCLFSLFFYSFCKYSMGNVPSSKKRKDRPSIIRADVPDNEYSNSTAASINSILVNSSLHRQQQLSQQQQQQQQQAPPPSTENAYQQQQPFPNSIPNSIPTNNNNVAANEQSVSSTQDLNQLTFSSQNQLTATSIRSIGRNLDIDECISRLLAMGNTSKVSKLPFRNSEIVAICRAAQEVFMSQPVRRKCVCVRMDVDEFHCGKRDHRSKCNDGSFNVTYIDHD